MAAILQMAANRALSSHLFEQVVSKPILQENDTKDIERKRHSWAVGSIAVVEALHRVGHDEVYKKGITVRGDAATCAYVSAEFFKNAETTRRFWPWLKPTIDGRQLAAELAPPSDASDWPIYKVQAIDVLLQTETPVVWTKVVSPCGTRLQHPVNLSEGEAGKTLRALWHMTHRAETTAEEALRNAVTKGGLLHQFATAKPKDPETVGLFLLTQLAFGSLGGPPDAAGESLQGFQNMQQLLRDPTRHKKAVDQFCDLMIQYRYTEPFWTTADLSSELADFNRYCIRRLADRRCIGNLVGARELASHWQIIDHALKPEEFRELLRGHVEDRSLLERVMGVTFSQETARLYAEMANVGAFEDSAFRGWLRESIASLDKQAWLRELRSETPLLDCVVKLKDQDASFGLGTEAADALRDHAEQVCQGTVTPKRVDIWKPFVDALIKNQRDGLAVRLGETLKSQLKRGPAAAAFYDLYGPVLREGDITEDPAFLPDIAGQMLAHCDLAGLAWVRVVLESDAAVLERHARTLPDFNDRLGSAFRKADDDGLKNTLYEIGAITGSRTGSSAEGEIAA